MIEEVLLIDYLKRETIRHSYTQELTYLSLSNVTAYVYLVKATVVWSCLAFNHWPGQRLSTEA
jgi:hypothetical protein